MVRINNPVILRIFNGSYPRLYSVSKSISKVEDSYLIDPGDHSIKYITHDFMNIYDLKSGPIAARSICTKIKNYKIEYYNHPDMDRCLYSESELELLEYYHRLSDVFVFKYEVFEFDKFRFYIIGDPIVNYSEVYLENI